MAFATINKPNQHFDTTTYTANGGSQTITNSGSMQPDFFWGKVRSTTSNHILINSIVGVSKYLYSNTTGAETTDANYLTSFNANGFSLGSNNYSNGTTMVAWQWKGGGTGVSNTAGSISSTVSANTTAGFSIVSYTGNATAGATIGHGLGAKPAMIIFKNRIDSSSAKWAVYHQAAFVSQADPNILYLDDTAARADDTNVLGNSTVTLNSTVFSLGDYNGTNGSGDGIIAYCFAEIKGFSKFGSYTGNGSTNGTFVYTGFKPAFVMIKRTDSTADWYIQDNVRNQNFNGDPKTLQANTTTSEASIGTWSIDNLSNGFKIRESNAAINASGGTYIYACFAQNPFVGTNNVPTTAR